MIYELRPGVHASIEWAVMAVLTHRRYEGRRLRMWEIVWALAVPAGPAAVARALERLGAHELINAEGRSGHKTYRALTP